MAEKSLKDWASKQAHKPTDVISNFDKLKAPFIINKYKTWGDLYNAVEIEPPVEKIEAEVKTQEESTTSGDLKSKITYGKTSLNAIKRAISSSEPGTERYKKYVKDYNDLQIKLNNFTNQYEDLKAIEDNISTVDSAKKKTGTIKSQIQSLEKSKKVSTDIGLDTKNIDTEIKKLKDELLAARKVIKETDVTPNYVEPKAGETGKPPVAGEKPFFGPTALTPTTPKTPKTPKVPGDKGGDGKDKGKEVKLTDAQQREEALATAAETDFALPETIFNNVGSLKTLLKRYVDEDWTPDKLRKAIRDDVWFRKNSDEIKKRYVQLYNYEDLVKTGQAQGSTDYEKQISILERQIADKARAMGSGAASDPEAIKKAARNMYITNVGIDDPMVNDFLAASIRPIGSMIGGVATEGYSGAALKNYQTLQTAAKANGFKLSDIIPGGYNERQVLEGIAKGTIDVNRVAQDARRLAAQGQPQYVRDLLGQGYDLDQVYAPYRQTMATILEIQDPNEIDLNDPTLRSAITDKGDMNLYDFKKALKKDQRWQYTENARTEIADTTLKVLRDFGFQG